MNFRTRPRGDQLSFVTTCHRCNGELSISNGRVDRRDCEPISQFAPNSDLDLEKVLAALDNR